MTALLLKLKKEVKHRQINFMNVNVHFEGAHFLFMT